jgi:hypothetical protein
MASDIEQSASVLSNASHVDKILLFTPFAFASGAAFEAVGRTWGNALDVDRSVVRSWVMAKLLLPHVVPFASSVAASRATFAA